MTAPSSRAAVGETGPAAARAVVGYIKLHASFPIYDGDPWDEPDCDAAGLLEVLVDNGLCDVLIEAVEHGSTTVTVQYRGDECSQRSPM